MKRIGLFGGSFDPPHFGHLLIAEKACEQLHLDEIIFIPAYRSPHKLYGPVGSPDDRLHMVKLAVKKNPLFSLSTIEFRRKAISYTVDTVRYFRTKYPDGKLFLIVGSDNLQSFHTWKDFREIMRLLKIAVYPRGTAKISNISTRKYDAVILAGEQWNISSRAIRTLVYRGKSVRYMIPDAVHRYIELHKLYR
jgi:nicotinate-nucleotide adenylyltransferase